MSDHSERSDINLYCCQPNSPPMISTMPAAIAPMLRSLLEEYFLLICCHAVGFGGRNSNSGACPVNHRAARLNAAESEASGGSVTPNSFGAYAATTSTSRPIGSKRSSISSASCCASSRGPKMRTCFTLSRNPAGNWPSVMRASRATRSGCNARRPPSFSIAPSNARNAATPPQVICNDTVLSPIASASTPGSAGVPPAG